MGGLGYREYLKLDALLGCQERESERAGRPAHDELLFIVTHQAYELWFKVVLAELAAVLRILGAPRVDERDLGRALQHLERIGSIQRLWLDQIDVLETMTPLDFLEFRDLLTPSSGFQSAQFRELENRLGLRRDQRLRHRESDYDRALAVEERDRVRASESEPTLFGVVDAWLARMPFLRFMESGADGVGGIFDFWREYRAAALRMLEADRTTIESRAQLGPAARERELERLQATRETFEAVLDPERYAQLRARGERRLSHPAFLAALMIALYRDEPLLQHPFRLLVALVGIDEQLALWRHRHADMVHRMIGTKIGTGGSSGRDYLQETVEAHRIFLDLFDLSTFLIPRSLRPPLPEGLRAKLGFRWDAV